MEMDAPLMNSSLFEHWTLPLTYAIALGIIAGGILGYIHFKSLKWNTRFYLNGGADRAIGLHILRFAILILVLVSLAKVGAWALISAMASLLVVRTIVVRQEKETL